MNMGEEGESSRADGNGGTPHSKTLSPSSDWVASLVDIIIYMETSQ